MALALLGAIWGVFLIVAFVRKRAEFRADSSIGAFQRQLQVLRRNSEVIDGLPASRTSDLSDPHSVHGEYDAQTGYGTTREYGSVATLARPVMRQSAYESAPYSGQPRMGRHAAGAEVAKHDPYFSREACGRRRDVLFILGSIIVSTGLIAIIPQARMMLIFTAFCGFALLVYLVLLVRLRAQAFERQMKLRYIPEHSAPASFRERRVVAR